ncbi:unnamed protein product [Lactuca saligna]|uniref:Uncharacterized protein n=1 Tax=Lactuca saligna TaxID=75948 RepID=A0AA36ELT1_LACSI|nr:unnamed protein product [Lactuca saligna]
MCEVPTLVSPHSKKRGAEDMAKKILKKKKKTKKRQLVIPTESSEEEVPETTEPKPIIEPTSPKKIVVIPLEVSSAKSSHEEVQTSDITANVSDTGVYGIMGEVDLSKESTQPPQDIGGGSSVSNFEIDGLMKVFEARMVSRVSGMIKDTESRILEKVSEDVNLKLQELRDNMVREFTVVQNDYATLHKKVDIICDAVKKYVTLYESLSPQITQLSTTENQ